MDYCNVHIYHIIAIFTPFVEHGQRMCKKANTLEQQGIKINVPEIPIYSARLYQVAELFRQISNDKWWCVGQYLGINWNWLRLYSLKRNNRTLPVVGIHLLFDKFPWQRYPLNLEGVSHPMIKQSDTFIIITWSAFHLFRFSINVHSVGLSSK